MSQFSQELCKLESSNLVYAWRMSDCIVGLKLGLIAPILLLVFVYFSFSSYFVCIVIVFSGPIEARTLKVGIHMENELLCCGIDKGAHCSYSIILHLSITLSF